MIVAVALVYLNVGFVDEYLFSSCENFVLFRANWRQGGFTTWHANVFHYSSFAHFGFCRGSSTGMLPGARNQEPYLSIYCWADRGSSETWIVVKWFAYSRNKGIIYEASYEVYMTMRIR